MIVAIAIILIIIVTYTCYQCKDQIKEGFAGALIQLTAKGPQDSYLTVDTDRYVPEYWYPRREYVWNNATRYPYGHYYYYPYLDYPYYY